MFSVLVGGNDVVVRNVAREGGRYQAPPRQFCCNKVFPRLPDKLVAASSCHICDCPQCRPTTLHGPNATGEQPRPCLPGASCHRRPRKRGLFLPVVRSDLAPVDSTTAPIVRPDRAGSSEMISLQPRMSLRSRKLDGDVARDAGPRICGALANPPALTAQGQAAPALRNTPG